MRFKHKLKLFFANLKRKKEKKEMVRELREKNEKKEPKFDKDELIESEEFSTKIVEKTEGLEQLKDKYSGKSDEEKAVRAVINAKLKILDWVVEEIYSV